MISRLTYNTLYEPSAAPQSKIAKSGTVAPEGWMSYLSRHQRGRLGTTVACAGSHYPLHVEPANFVCFGHVPGVEVLR